MPFETFLYEKEGPVAKITFNRPEKLNPVNETVFVEFEEILRDLQGDFEVRVVVLTGSGRSFSVGADLDNLSKGTDPGYYGALTDRQRKYMARQGSIVCRALEELDQITIAAINGFAVGGGIAFAICCDFRIAAQSATFWIPEVDFGVPLVWSSIPRMITQLGPLKAKELIMTCDRFSAQEAFEAGMLNRVVPDGELDQAVDELAGKLLSKPPMALSRTKASINAVLQSYGSNVGFCDPDFAILCAGSDDAGEAVRAFKEKRAGNFKGR